MVKIRSKDHSNFNSFDNKTNSNFKNSPLSGMSGTKGNFFDLKKSRNNTILEKK